MFRGGFFGFASGKRGGGGSAPPDPYQSVTPGAGWSGASSDPSPVGDPDAIAYDELSEGRWLHPQYDSLTGDTIIYLKAQHVPIVDEYNLGHWPGVEMCKFAVNDGPVVTVTEPELLPAPVSGKAGYYAWPIRIRESDYTPGENYEMRVEIVPYDGTPRMLQGAAHRTNRGSFWFHIGAPSAPSMYVATSGNDSTGDGSSGNPFATYNRALLAAATANGGYPSGATIYMGAGSHTIGSGTYTTKYDTPRYVTVTRWPGVDQEDVELVFNTSSDGHQVSKIRLKEVTTKNSWQEKTGFLDFIWFDDVIHDPGSGYIRVVTGADPCEPLNFNGGVYHIGGSVKNCPNACGSATLVKGVTIGPIASDAFQSARCVIDCRVTEITAGATESAPGVPTVPADSFHPDMLQLYQSTGGTFDGGIYDCIRADEAPDINTQGIFLKDNALAKNVFFNNISFDNAPSGRNVWVVTHDLEHCMIYDCDLNGDGPVSWGTGAFTAVVSAGTTRYRGGYAPIKAQTYPIPSAFDFTSGSLPPGATLTRSNAGHYHDAADNNIIKSAATNAPRWQQGGLLYEPASTNRITSQTSAGTGLSAEVTSGLNYSTDGFLYNGNAHFAKITINSSNSQHYDRFSAYTPPGSSLTWVACYLLAKVGTPFIQLAVGNNHASVSSQTYVNFDPATGTVTAQGSAVSNVLVEDWGGGNYRVSFAYTTKASPTSETPLYICFIPNGTAGFIPTFTGNGTDCFIWYCAQVCYGEAFLTSWPGSGGSGNTRNTEALTLVWSTISVADGTHDIAYTFENDSTQAVPETVVSGSDVVRLDLDRRVIKAAAAVS